MSEKPQPVEPRGAEGKPPAAEGAKHVPGDGIRSLKTSAAFRTLNFELYAKPVKYNTIIVFYVNFMFLVGNTLYDTLFVL